MDVFIAAAYTLRLFLPCVTVRFIKFVWRFEGFLVHVWIML